MPPRPDSSTRALLRNATTRAASARLRAPATQAAAISPWLWPTTAAGWTPCERHSAASDTSTANSAGCTTSTRSRPGAPGVWRSTSSRDQSVTGSRAAAHSAIRSANTGEVVSSSRPMPSHCAPWPGKTNTVLPVTSTRSVARLAAGSASASAARPRRNAGRSAPTTTPRWSKALRVVSSEYATSAGSAGGCASIRASRAAA